MSTDFFERQATAHRHTGRLVWLFCLAVIGIVAASWLVAFLAVNYVEASNTAHGRPTPPGLAMVPLYVAIASALLILLGTLYKIVELRGGGLGRRRTGRGPPPAPQHQQSRRTPIAERR